MVLVKLSQAPIEYYPFNLLNKGKFGSTKDTFQAILFIKNIKPFY